MVSVLSSDLEVLRKYTKRALPRNAVADSFISSLVYYNYDN